MSTILLALNHDCPFCGAVAGSPCRTRTKAGRPGGREQSRPHSRRIARTRPNKERQRVNALCCVCGEIRTVDDHHRKGNDPNAMYGPQGKSSGWRNTQTLKCQPCGGQTRHATMLPADSPYANSDESQQLIALGDPDTSRYGHLTDLELVRRKYREMPFPRNPHLGHRWLVDDAKAAWDDGSKMVTALCGEAVAVERDPRQTEKHSTKERNAAGYIVAEQLGDTEYEDPDTGLWWVDMDCVDCCRVSNARMEAKRRQRLELLLMRFATRPELIPDDRVHELARTLEAWLESEGNR